MMSTGRIEPLPGQESVWDYPRPPRLEPSARAVTVVLADGVVARSERALRVLETGSAPTYYLPEDDVATEYLRRTRGATWCGWKGRASYFDVVVGERRARRAAWAYLRPKPAFADIAGWHSFYPGRVDACLLGDELVRAQPGGFYGGWVTDDIVGPFKRPS
jgi:uncharacterized protein (DUF427 family)